MKLISQIKEIKIKFLGKFHLMKVFQSYSWFNLGGPAKVIFKPKT